MCSADGLGSGFYRRRVRVKAGAVLLAPAFTRYSFVARRERTWPFTLYVIRLFASGGLAAKYRLMPFMIAFAILSR
jgi:hypothetical protein